MTSPEIRVLHLNNSLLEVQFLFLIKILHKKTIMKKCIATFIFGAATGGISSAFALRSDIYQDNQVKYKYDEEKFY